MSAFAAAARRLVGDPNLGADASYVPAAPDAATVALRAVLSRPVDPIPGAPLKGSAGSFQATILVEAVAEPRRDDRLTIAGVTYRVAGAPRRDTRGTLWLLPLVEVPNADPAP